VRVGISLRLSDDRDWREAVSFVTFGHVTHEVWFYFELDINLQDPNDGSSCGP